MCSRRPPISTNLPEGAGAPSLTECCPAIDKGRTNSVNMPTEHLFQNALALRIMILFLPVHLYERGLSATPRAPPELQAPVHASSPTPESSRRHSSTARPPYIRC